MKRVRPNDKELKESMLSVKVIDTIQLKTAFDMIDHHILLNKL